MDFGTLNILSVLRVSVMIEFRLQGVQGQRVLANGSCFLNAMWTEMCYDGI